MTCIIGYKDGDDVYLASDSAATSLDGSMDICNMVKIIRIEDYLIGFAGSIRPAQIFRTQHFSMPEDDSDIINFIENYREAMEKTGCLSINDDGTHESGTSMIIIHKNILYVMYTDFQVHDVDINFICIGSGSDYAYGALKALEDYDMPVQEKLEKCLTISSFYNSSVRPPWQIVKY